MKNCLKVFSAFMLICSLFLGCKGEIQYVDRIVEKEKIIEVEKTYASSVTFAAISAEGAVNVTMATVTEGAKIYYTTDGTEPSAESIPYSAAVALLEDTTFKAIAVKEGIENSPVSYAKYSVVNKIETKIETKIEEKEVYVDKTYASPILFTANDEEYGVSLVLSTETQGAAIYYTTDGSVPTASSTPYTQALKIKTNTTIKAIAIKESIESSPISVASVTIKKINQSSGGAGNPLQITLTSDVPHDNGYTGNKSNTRVTVTANISTASNVKKVVWKKDGSLIAKVLLADNSVNAASVTADNSVWNFDIEANNETANGTYTVAAIDEDGREEAEQIVIDNFDFTPPAKVKVTNAVYSSELCAIIFNWTEPSDSDYDHVGISFTSNDGITNSSSSIAVSVSKGTTNKTFTDIDGTIAYYTYTFVSYDKLGNKGEEYRYKIPVKYSMPEGFVLVSGTTITGKERWIPESSVFVSGERIVIPNLIVCDHEVTRGEYKELIGTDPSIAPAYDKDGNLLTGDNVLNNPVNYINWYDALVYCNKLSEKEHLTPCYSISGSTNPKDWGTVPTSKDSTWNAAICNFENDGYRLPTNAEWEWLARGEENYDYAGSNILDDVGWYTKNTKDTGTRDVKAKQENAYGLYDMCGNVEEWCWDWQTDNVGTRRIRRGGHWYGGDSNCLICNNSNGFIEVRTKYIGFRVVRNAN